VSKLSGQIAALGAVFITAVTLTACGGGIPGDAVVSVNGNAISNATFNHWMGVAANSSSASAAAAGKTAPKAVVPDPPTYKACIAHLEATAPKPAKGQAKPTAATLKTQCEQQYTALKQQVLSNEHSPPQFRAIGATRNQDEWYAAFGAKPGEKYYLPPDQRVHLW